MKAAVFVLLLAICTIESRKIVPISKNANMDFINMEIGGGARPVSPPRPAPAQSPEPPKSPAPTPQPKSPAPAVTTAKPVPVAVPTVAPVAPIKPVQPRPVQPRPAQTLPNQMDLKPVPAKPASAGTVTTPGPGNVKQLVGFYDSQGQAGVIKPYSYSQAVKQG